MSKNAWISVSVFLALLVLVIATREDKVSVGIRTLEMPQVAKEAVEKIEVGGKHKAVLEKDGAAWTVKDPTAEGKKLAAETTLIESMLDSLAELEAGNFVTGRKEKHQELEIDDEKGLFVTLKQKGQPDLALVFGRTAQGGGNYLRLKGKDEVFVGKGRLAQLLSKDVNGWRKKRLLDASAEDLVSIGIEPAGSESYSLAVREEGEGEARKVVWGLGADVRPPDGFRTDEELVRRVATGVSSLRAVEFVDEDPGEAQTGLGASPAGGRLVVNTKAGKPLAVRFGKEDGSNRVYAQLEGAEQIYLLPSYQLKNVLKPLNGLRDLSLARFDPQAVTRLSIRGAEGLLEVEKRDGAWTLVAPTALPDGFELDLGRVEGTLTSLARLKGTERYDAGLPEAGLLAPTASITLELEGGVTKTIAFGKDVADEAGGKKVYARGAEEESVYAVGHFQKARFDKPLELLKKLAPPPAPPGGHGGGMIPGMENLPPDVRKKLEESLRQQGLPGR